MISNVRAKDIMTIKPLTLIATMPIELAIDLLIEKGISGAPVVSKNGKLVGFLSVHDVMVDLWSQDYTPTKPNTVADLMSSTITTIDVNEKLINIVEHLCLDKVQLYPTSNMGIGISNKMASISIEDRAKQMAISKPHILPVLNNSILVGVISRMEVIKALRPTYLKDNNMEENNVALKFA